MAKEQKQSPVVAAANTVAGEIKGGVTGFAVGGPLWAAIGALAGVVTSFFLPEMVTAAAADIGTALSGGAPATATQAAALGGGAAATAALSTVADTSATTLALQGAAMGGIAGGVVGGVGHAVTGSLAGAAAGWMNTRPLQDDGAAKEQIAQIAYAQGLVQGATMAKVEAVEQHHEEVSTKWRAMHPSKAGESQVSMVNDQAAKAALAAMEPQGRA